MKTPNPFSFTIIINNIIKSNYYSKQTHYYYYISIIVSSKAMSYVLFYLFLIYVTALNYLNVD